MFDGAPFVASTMRDKVVQELMEENERRGNRNVPHGDIVLPLAIFTF
jgi:hypothetical protein